MEPSVRDHLVSPTFKRMVDATLTASALMVGLSFLWGDAGPEMLLVDVGLSVFLILVGASAGVRFWLLASSSLPLYALDLIWASTGLEHLLALVVVGLRLARVAADLAYLHGHASLVGREIIALSVQAGVMAAVMLFGGSVALYVAERGAPGATIRSLGDALWASIATTTTVGYGDTVPVTGLGRLVAAMLMIFGVAYITFLITNIATLLVRIAQAPHLAEDLPPAERELQEIVETLRTRLHELGDEEFLALMNRLNLIRIIKAAGEDSEILALPPDGRGGSSYRLAPSPPGARHEHP